jgi:hypothetical protein
MKTENVPQHSLTVVGELNVASVPLLLMFLFLFAYGYSKYLLYPSIQNKILEAILTVIEIAGGVT